jgi:hypothetical protein
MSCEIQRKDFFLSTLWEILNEQNTTIKTQFSRLQKMWDDNWPQLPIKFPEVRRISLDMDLFHSSLPNRLECVRTLQYAMTDTYFVIKSVVTSIFKDYLGSGFVKNEFVDEDLFALKYLIGEILVGSLLQFIAMEPDLVALDIIIVAKNKAILKLKGRNLTQIHQDLEKNGIHTSPELIHGLMEQLAEHGYLTITNDEIAQVPFYRFTKDFQLSGGGMKVFLQKIKPILEWTVEIWRSLYNIRSIDTVIPDDYPYRDFLVETVKRAATQGYLTAYNVMENIGNYYQLCLDNGIQ